MHSKKIDRRAQGTIEYLVALSMIIVVGLIVISFASSLVDSTQTYNVDKKIKQQIGTGGISITEMVSDSDGNGIVSLRNNSGGDINVTRIRINGEDNNYSDIIVSGDGILFFLDRVSSNCVCAEGEHTKQCDLEISYMSEDGLNKTVIINTFIECVDDANGGDGIIDPDVPPTPDTDTTPPTITLTSPADANSTTNTTIDFNFIVTDTGSAIQDCNLYIGGDVNGTGLTSVTEDINISFTRTLVPGTYNWDVNCKDTNGNNGTSGGTNTLTINTIGGGGGDEPIAFVESCWNASANPKPICNCNDLNLVRDYLSSNFTIMNDINMNVSECSAYQSGAGWDPITVYTGDFDGNGKKIYNLYSFRPDQNYVGLFGYISYGSTINSLGLIDVNITGIDYVGGLVGFARDSYTYTIDKVMATGNVYGKAWVGGLVGHLYDSRIINAYSHVNVFVSDLDGGSVSIRGPREGGSLTGRVSFQGYITDSYATGNVVITDGNSAGGLTGGGHGDVAWSFHFEADSSFATGNVSADINAGGLAGYVGKTTSYWQFLNSYWNNTGTPSGCTGLYASPSGCTAIDDNISYFYDVNNAPMTSWGFDDTNWSSICDGVGYPPLKWENITDTSDCLT